MRRRNAGGLIFFGKGRCVACHAVAGDSNEMFSDFQMHMIGVPQIAPEFGVELGNVIFDGPCEDQDLGLEQITGNPADRYKFRTSPLRNPAVAGVNETFVIEWVPSSPFWLGLILSLRRRSS